MEISFQGDFIITQAVAIVKSANDISKEKKDIFFAVYILSRKPLIARYKNCQGSLNKAILYKKATFYDKIGKKTPEKKA